MRFKWPDVKVQNQQIAISTVCPAVLLTAAGYYLSARLGLAFSFQPDYIAALWFPNAVLLCALLLFPARYWIFFLLAVIPAELAADLPAGISPGMALGFVLSDWVEVGIAAWALRQLTGGDFQFRGLKQFILFLGACVLVGPFFSAFPGAYINWRFEPLGPSFWVRWGRWFMSDALTHLTVTPCLYLWLTLKRPLKMPRLPLAFYGEIMGFAFLLMVAGAVAFGGAVSGPGMFPNLAYAPVPLLLWAAVRFGPRGAFSAALFLTLISVWNAAAGRGPFVNLSPAVTVFNLQFFLMIALSPALFLSVLMEEQKNTKEKLHESEERFREIVDCLPDMVFEIDTRGNFTFVNQSGLATFQYSREEFEKGLFRAKELIVPEDRDRVAANFIRVRAGENLGLNEYRALRKDGSVLPCLIHSSAIRRGGEIVGIRGGLTNISKFKIMEANLKESEARYRHLIQSTPAGIFEVDFKKMRYTSVNDIMCKYTGYTREELLNIDPRVLLTEDNKHGFKRFVEDAYAGKPIPAPVEYKVKGKNGREIWVVITNRFFYENGVPVRAMSVAHDVTDLRKVEEEKKLLEAQLHQAQKMEALGTLAGGIAHDFNNLLMGIQGNTSLLRLNCPDDAAHQDKLKSIQSYVQRAVDLTRQLLGLAKAGKYEVKPADINELIQAALGIFERTTKEVVIHKKFADDVRAVEVDKSQMEMVFLNLFVNAWHAMPGGGDLFIETRNTVLSQSDAPKYGAGAGDYVQISVTDTGIGMDASIRKRIFDPFFTTKDKDRGTGLGLASAYGVIKNHDGVITVKSEPGNGATFDVFLPATGKIPQKEKEMSEALHGGNETILFVDDEPMILEVGGEMLSELGYRVLAANGGQEALDIFASDHDRIDLVILDMIMPKLGGGETYDRLKAIDPDVRVILSSGYSIDGEASEILRKGCNGFIQKPFGLGQLSAKIREVVGG